MTLHPFLKSNYIYIVVIRKFLSLTQKEMP